MRRIRRLRRAVRPLGSWRTVGSGDGQTIRIELTRTRSRHRGPLALCWSGASDSNHHRANGTTPHRMPGERLEALLFESQLDVLPVRRDSVCPHTVKERHQRQCAGKRLGGFAYPRGQCGHRDEPRAASQPRRSLARGQRDGAAPSYKRRRSNEASGNGSRSADPCTKFAAAPLCARLAPGVREHFRR